MVHACHRSSADRVSNTDRVSRYLGIKSKDKTFGAMGDDSPLNLDNLSFRRAKMVVQCISAGKPSTVATRKSHNDLLTDYGSHFHWANPMALPKIYWGYAPDKKHFCSCLLTFASLKE